MRRNAELELGVPGEMPLDAGVFGIGMSAMKQSLAGELFTGFWVMRRKAELELGVPGKSLWMREYWDRYIRNEEHLRTVIEYIHQNPVKARLCQFPESWRWSSACQGTLSLNVAPQEEDFT